MSWTCTSCGFDDNDDSALRCSCGHEVEDNVPPNYNRIGGALYFVAGGLILVPALYVLSALDRFENGLLQSTAMYLIEGTQALIFVLVPLTLLAMLFARKKKFRLCVILYYSVAFLIALGNYLLIKSMPQMPNYYKNLNNAIDTAVISFFVSGGWIAYFKFSERAKQTFTN